MAGHKEIQVHGGKNSRCSRGHFYQKKNIFISRKIVFVYCRHVYVSTYFVLSSQKLRPHMTSPDKAVFNSRGSAILTSCFKRRRARRTVFVLETRYCLAKRRGLYCWFFLTGLKQTTSVSFWQFVPGSFNRGSRNAEPPAACSGCVLEQPEPQYGSAQYPQVKTIRREEEKRKNPPPSDRNLCLIELFSEHGHEPCRHGDR